MSVGRARQFAARLRLCSAGPARRRRRARGPGQRGLRRYEDGAVFPVVISVIMVVFMMAVALFYVGRAGDLRTRAQTAADAAALGAAAEIRDRALDMIVQGYLPFSGFDPQSTPAAARDYAKRNGARVDKVDYGDMYGHTVKVDVQGTQRVEPGERTDIAPRLAEGFATADAIAEVTFPSCFIVIAPGIPVTVTGVQCGATFVPVGANPADYIRLFEIRLVDKLPPKCGTGVGLGGLPPGSGKTARPVNDITPSSHFGIRDGEPHNGTDFPGGGNGAPIYAFADGVVRRAGPASGFGQWIVIDHNLGGQKVSSVYGHMYPDGVLVREGQRVTAGQPIGKVGNNGHSTGPHLHFELWRGGRFDGGSPYDPYPSVQQSSSVGGGGGGDVAMAVGLAACAGPGGPVSGSPGDAKLCASAAKAAGFRGEDLVTITAIGMAESGCRPDAQNANTNGSVDYGLFQINTIHGYPLSCLTEPSCNAQKAYEIYRNRGSFLDWCTYEAPACGGNGNGSYRKYLGVARQAVAGV